MKLSEITIAVASELGIMPVHSRVQKLLKLKAIIDAVPYDPATAGPAQQEFVAESADAREGLGEAWDRVSLAITMGWDIPDTTIAALAMACADNARRMPKLFAD